MLEHLAELAQQMGQMATIQYLAPLPLQVVVVAQRQKDQERQQGEMAVLVAAVLGLEQQVILAALVTLRSLALRKVQMVEQVLAAHLETQTQAVAAEARLLLV